MKPIIELERSPTRASWPNPLSTEAENMVAPVEVVRLAMAVFDDLASLRRTIASLLSLGLKCDQLSLAGDVSTIGALSAPDASPDASLVPAAGSLAVHLRSLEDGDGVITFAGRDAGFIDMLVGSHAAAGKAEPASPGEINWQIAPGALMLIAKAATGDQHVRIARLLLSHARGKVQTYEFKPPTNP